jgi:hypothetical protein
MSNSPIFLTTTLSILSLCAQAADLPGVSFPHHDWQLVCDNTRTCRAAGYQSDDNDLAVSVLLTREAGPSQPVTGELMIGDFEGDDPVNQLPPEFELTMRINGQNLGQVLFDQGSREAELSTKQVNALLESLRHTSTIEWGIDKNHWHLSDKGAAAVLLKMDEFKGRVGTQGALIKKGPLNEAKILPPLPIPVIIAAPVAKPLPSDNQLAIDNSKALREALLASIKDDDCSDLEENDVADAELSAIRLTNNKLLASARCWAGAYNSGYGYWVINDVPPYSPVLVTTSGSGYSEGVISAAHKGRGLGDCWSTDDWAWDGKQFVHTGASSTGMCKLLAVGGAWSLPTIVTDVRRSPR